METVRPTIESLQNDRIKQVVRLRDASARRKAGRFLIDGWREIELAAKHGVAIETIYFDSPTDSRHERLSIQVDLSDTTLQPVSPKVLERISYGQRDQAPVAVAITPQFELQRLQWQAPQIVLVLDRTEKPGNLGACLRSASAAGVAAVILTDPVCEPCNPNTIRASRGSLFTVPLAVTTRAEFQAYSRHYRIPSFAARVTASTELWDQDFTSGGAFLFGSEAHGLDHDWFPPAPNNGLHHDFIIPMRGSPDSLNLSISTAITLYEAVRQQRTI